MLESVVSNKVTNIGLPFDSNCGVKLNIGTWFGAENLKSICSNSNRQYRKRYHSSTFEKEHLSNQTFEGSWKRRREYINKQGDFISNKNKRRRRLKTDSFRKNKEFDRMTRTTCCQLRRHNDARLSSHRHEHSETYYQRNRSLSQSNDGSCLPHHQMPAIDDGPDHIGNGPMNRRHFNSSILHQISSHTPHTVIHGKESLTAPNISNNINNYCHIPSAQISQPAPLCGLNNPFPVTPGHHATFRPSNQTNACSQSTRRRHHITDLISSYQAGVSSSAQYQQSHAANVATSQSSISACNIPNRTMPTNASSYPLVTRSFCQNPNQLRFTTYPLNPYTAAHHQTMFSRASLPSTTILPHNSAFCSTVQMPTVIGDVISSTPCRQCAIMAGSGLNTYSNLSSIFQFSVAPSAASLITLAAVSGDRIHGSRLSYLPMHAISNWQNQHPYLPAAWSYNDLSSILHNSTARHILQDHMAQRLLSASPNIGIQFVMMTPSSVLGSNEASQIRHLIPVSRTDSLSPIAVSRYLPIIDHFPLIEQPRPGITKQELDQIPVKKFVKSVCDHMTPEGDKDRCMICLEDFIPNEIIRLLKCSHDFHSSCVERWLKINRTCPLCRADASGPPTRKS